MSLDRTVPPTAEPILPKDAIEFSCAEDGDAQRFRRLITRAREYVENYCNRSLMTQTWVQRFDCFSSHCIALYKPPIQSITSITYYDENNAQQTLASSLYEVALKSEPAVLRPVSGQTWPNTYDRLEAIEITYVAGYQTTEEIPVAITEAMLMLTDHWFEHRGAVTELRLAEPPITVNDLLFPHKVFF